MVLLAVGRLKLAAGGKWQRLSRKVREVSNVGRGFVKGD
jgi:hypothetical protein